MNITYNQLQQLLQRPIAFHRVFADVAGSATGGLFLSQLFYWSNKGNSSDGWIYKTKEDWTRETALKRSEQDSARKALRGKKVLEEKMCGIPRKLYYRLNQQALVDAIAEITQNRQNDQNSLNDSEQKPKQPNNNKAGSCRQGSKIQQARRQNPAGKEAKSSRQGGKIQQANTEITSETTTEITSENNSPLTPQGEIERGGIKNESDGVASFSESIKTSVVVDDSDSFSGNASFSDVKQAPPAACDNSLLPDVYPKNIDGSDRLPWHTNKRYQFDSAFERHMARSLSKTTFYKTLSAGEVITRVRKHIAVGNHNLERRAELEIEWQALHAPDDFGGDTATVGELENAEQASRMVSGLTAIANNPAFTKMIESNAAKKRNKAQETVERIQRLSKLSQGA